MLLLPLSLTLFQKLYAFHFALFPQMTFTIVIY